ncbi:DUF6448 family protein [Phenylobacterium sp.]|uniref:DUF6448 family protein n=1 Tax=Phenylobacterium sp. TaxID=1871053 RepID=UPI002CDB95D3|nr:DUF6448 family protein [Phenylobacterium sp.]HVI32270.1 DUF6448 family protein [Phenylobacterium sp.]
MTSRLGPVLAVALLASAFAAPPAAAHCDMVDGPVAKAALKALDTGNVNLALPYAPVAAEAEIRARFDAAHKVRSLGPDARALADHAFMETVVRLHRQGEGAAFQGLKPAGLDHGPAIPAAEAAVNDGDLTRLRAVLRHDIDEGLEHRLRHVRETQDAPAEARTPEDVAEVRARVSAELGFVTYAETLRQAAMGEFDHPE